jgi:pimeloyl-ACP methyl ester carboxylesterase
MSETTPTGSPPTAPEIPPRPDFTRLIAMYRPLLAVIAILAIVSGIPNKGKKKHDRKATPETSMAAVVAASAKHDQQNAAARKQKKANQKKPGSAKAGGPYTVTQIDIPAVTTGTGFMERIQVMTPFGYSPSQANVPMLLVANGYGLSAGSFYNGMSDFPDEANNRGWLICVVTQLDDKSFGAWNKPQGNVAAALDYMVANYRVDPDRIYGIGWSAGGGAMASYAARHLDPASPMIAAVVTNAGSVDLVDVYDSEVPAVKTIMENVNLFQGNPAFPAYHYNYERTETIFTVQSTGALNSTYCQARNLKNIPIYHVYSTDDTIPYLPLQNQMYASYLQSIGANIVTNAVTGTVPSHSWNLLDEHAVLDWCEQFTVNRNPASFQLNADRSADYYWSTLTQRTTGQYSRIEVTANTATNDLQIEGLENLSAVELAPPQSVLSLQTRLTLSVENTDAATVALTLTAPGMTNPSYILDGTDVFDDWTFTGTEVVIQVPAMATTDFTISFDSYTGVLTAPATTTLGTNLPITLQGSTPNQPYMLLISTFVYPTPVALIDPTDTRYILAGFDASTVLLLSTLSGTGSASFNVFIPQNPTYQNVELAMQFVTYPGFTTIIDEISNLARTRLQ